MQRREFISLLSGVAVYVAARGAGAQQPVQQSGIHLVGFLSDTTREGFEPNAAALREGLKEVGFIEGRNLAIEYRLADDHYDRLSALAADLIEHRVALIAADPRGCLCGAEGDQDSSHCFYERRRSCEKRPGGEPQSTGWKPDRRHGARERPERQAFRAILIIWCRKPRSSACFPTLLILGANLRCKKFKRLHMALG